MINFNEHWDKKFFNYTGRIGDATLYRLSPALDDDEIWRELAETVHCPKCGSVDVTIVALSVKANQGVAWNPALLRGEVDICCCEVCYHPFGLLEEDD